MSYMLYTGQILEALQELKHPEADSLIAQFHDITDRAGTALAITLGIERNNLSELWDNNAGVSFKPAFPGQLLPEAIRYMDSESEWTDE